MRYTYWIRSRTGRLLIIFLAIYFFSILVLLFPKNTLSYVVSSNVGVDNLENKPRTDLRRYSNIILRSYLMLLTFLAIASIVYNIFYKIIPLPLLNTLNTLSYIYDVVALSGILTTMGIIYRLSSSHRERQQLRLFVSGVILAVAPLLFLTVLPQALNLLPQYVVDAQLSTITLALLPLVLGYTILRYQFLVFDMYIRRAVAWIVGVVGLIILGYIVVTLSSLLFSKK